MLFLLFGSSGAGKTTVLEPLRARVPELAVHEFDEVGVPSQPTLEWRHRENERWIERALEYQAQGVDLLLAGQTPLGELIAAPSAPRLEAISACLLDCRDDVRAERLRARGAECLAHAPGELEDFVRWGSWMREHAVDPRFMPHVIERPDGWGEMQWERLRELRRGDARWRVHVVDTSDVSVSDVVDALVAWIEDERVRFRQPLAR